jgi:Ca2+-binding RTX toxin-like protein
MPTVNGTNGADTLYGTGGSDQINGLNGDDSLKGLGGADRIDGGAGVDTAFYTDSAVGVAVNLETGRGAGGTAEGDRLFNIENLYGSAFGDSLIGNDASNELYGLNGSDVLKGGGGADRLDGGSGDDILKGGGGNDILQGDAGIDTADYSMTEGSGVGVSLYSGTATGGAGSDTLSGIENVIGSAYRDVLQGDGGANVLRGQDGDDSLYGDNGDDTLDGGAGADDLTGGLGRDTLIGGDGGDVLRGGFGSRSDPQVDSAADSLIGGNGDDVYHLDHPGDASDTIIEYANEGVDLVTTSFDYTLGANLEHLRLNFFAGAINGSGNELDNTINGSGSDNVLDGRAGVDNLIGHHGNDTYIVDNVGDVVIEAVGQGALDRVRTSVTYVLGAGAEVEVLETTDPAGTAAIDLVGNAFDQTIFGNSGSNTIVGGMGLDTMIGNGSGDVFVWTSTAESGVAGNEADVIADFDRAAGDVIAVNPIDADETIGGDQAFAFIGTGPLTGAAQISTFTTATDTYILLSTDADATQEMTVRLAGVHAVDASWFAL